MLETRGQGHLLILCDDERVGRIIRITLGPEYRVTLVQAGQPVDAQPASSLAEWDLVVVVLTSFAGEPIVALSRAALVQQVGRVPLLIISERPFEPDMTSHIQHLGFPFTAEQLAVKVREIVRLGERSDGGTEE